MSHATAQTIAQITEVVTRVTRILSGKQIKVIQQGMKIGVEYDAYGAPSAVFLPSLSENPHPDLIVAIQGFLDKEVSGLLYTDFNTRHKYTSTSEFKKGMAHSLQDIIEDARTEREMRKAFKGSASNFDKNHDFAVKEILGPQIAAAKNQNQAMATLAYPAIRAACGDLAYEEFMDGKWEQLGKLGGAILHYAEDIQSCETTEETFQLTRKIIEKMEEQDGGDGDSDEGEGEGEEGDEEGEGEGSGGSSGGGGSAAGDAGEGDDDEEEGDDGKGDDDKGGDEDDKEDEGDGSKPPPTPQDKSDLSKNNKSDKTTKQKGAQPSGHSGTTQGKQSFSELDNEFDNLDFDKTMQDKIKHIAGTDAAKQGAYTPYTRQFDYVGPLPNPREALKSWPQAKQAQMMLEEVDKNSHVIQQQIQRLFVAKAAVRWEPGQKRGKLNPAALYKLPTTQDPRIFRQKIETNSRDLAVSLVIDMSGSMGGTKIQNAVIAALMFGKVLTALNIKHEICAFSTYHGHYGGSSAIPNVSEVNKMIQETPRTFKQDGRDVYWSRVCPIMQYIIKGFDKRLDEDTRKVAAMIPTGYRNLMAANVDGESIEIAGRRLLRQNEKKKVMIVMSDGQPAGDGHGGDLVQHLKATVKALSASGIEMLGLGLQDESVKQFYPKYEIVRSTDQIPTKILELTQKMVIGA